MILKMNRHGNCPCPFSFHVPTGTVFCFISLSFSYFLTPKMKKTDELLQLIENGDPTTILSEDDLVERLNFLLKWDLITITADEIRLTQKGKEAKMNGVSSVIEEESFNEQLLEFSKKKKKKNKFLNFILRKSRK